MIKEFLLKHPLISPHGIEKVLGLPVGTIRIDNGRPIPEKHQQAIINLLSDYGFKQVHDSATETISAEPVIDTTEPSKAITDDLQECIVRNNAIGIVNGFFRRLNINDNAIVLVKKLDINS